MRLLRKTAVRPQRNIVGKRFRGLLVLADIAGKDPDYFRNLLDMGWDAPIVGASESANNSVAFAPVMLPRDVVVTTDQNILQGDMVWWDSVNYTLKQLTLTSQVAVGNGTGGYAGVVQGTSQPNVYPAQPSGISEDMPGLTVQRGGAAYLNSTSGDGAYVPFQPVTVGADQQTVTRGGETSSNRVGLVLVAPPTSPRGAPGATPAPETDNSSRVAVWLEPKWPGTYLL